MDAKFISCSIISFLCNLNKAPIHWSAHSSSNLSIHLFNPSNEPNINSLRNPSHPPLIHWSDFPWTLWPHRRHRFDQSVHKRHSKERNAQLLCRGVKCHTSALLQHTCMCNSSLNLTLYRQQKTKNKTVKKRTQFMYHCENNYTEI